MNKRGKKMDLLRNRRGDVSTILLFVVTITLVVVALFFMASFNINFVKDSEGRNDVLSLIKFYESYSVHDVERAAKETVVSGGLIMTDAGLKSRFQEKANREFTILGLENYFGKIKRGEFDFEHDNAGYLFEMKNLSFVADSGANSFSRKLDFRIRFNSDGDVINLERFINKVG